MKKMYHTLFLLGILIFSPGLFAQTLVLVQGYLGSADAWRDSGVTEKLIKAGWTDAGNLNWFKGKVSNKGFQKGAKRFYTLSLPSEAGMLTQVGIFSDYLNAIKSVHPDDALILAGHSAGGVLARFYMVKHPEVKIEALITISSPHMGTELAEIGTLIGNTPLGWMTPMIGAGKLNQSQNLFNELSREKPYNFLYWLNRQIHPESTYISVIRASDSGLSGDLVVPSWSQDMNNVYSLRGKSQRMVTRGDHSLTAEDGILIDKLIKNLNKVTSL